MSDKKKGGGPYAGQVSNNGVGVLKGQPKDNGKRAATVTKGNDLRVRGGKGK